MKRLVTIKPNPSKQERERKVLEISFTDSQGEYQGCLLGLRFAGDTPVINLYSIDPKIQVIVEKR